MKVFASEVRLYPGEYEYKFVVDGNWMHDDSKEVLYDDRGNANNILKVKWFECPCYIGKGECVIVVLENGHFGVVKARQFANVFGEYVQNLSLWNAMNMM